MNKKQTEEAVNSLRYIASQLRLEAKALESTASYMEKVSEAYPVPGPKLSAKEAEKVLGAKE